MAHYASKSYRTYQVLQLAHNLEIPSAGNIRAWMNLEHVASTYRVSLVLLHQKLDLPNDTSPQLTLAAAAEQNNIPAIDYVLLVQQSLAEMIPPEIDSPTKPANGWYDSFMDSLLSALVLYGYPVLALVIYFGALGVPVPAGPLTAITGAMSLQGDFNALIACFIIILFSILGDVTGYWVGRTLPPEFLNKWGRWFGYSTKNRQRIEKLFDKWGGLTLILTRSIISQVSFLASTFAGTERYHLIQYILFSIVGRLFWLAAYFGIGYTAGKHIEVASGFLGYLSLFLISLIVMSLTVYLLKKTATSQHAAE